MPLLLAVEDDQHIIQYVIRPAVQRLGRGWNVAVATTGREALELFRTHADEISVVLLDVILGQGDVIDGRLVALRIRDTNARLPIIPFTSHDDALPALRDLNCELPITKPSGADEVARTLRRVVENRSMNTRPRQGNRQDGPWLELARDVVDRVDPPPNVPKTLDTTVERAPVLDADESDIDIALVVRHIALAKQERRFQGPSDPEEYLRDRSCLVYTDGRWVPTQLGLLAFCNAPERFIPAAGIDLAGFAGGTTTSRKLLHERLRGTIFDQITAVFTILWSSTKHDYRLEGARRVEIHEYPEDVLREGTANAICHRDWSASGSRVRVQKYEDRIEWISPGSLPPGTNIRALRTAQVSRNPLLSQILYEAGFVEGFGLGVDRILDAMAALQAPQPTFHDDGNYFTLTVFGSPTIGETARTIDTLPLTDRQKEIYRLLQRGGTMNSENLCAAVNGGDLRNVQRDLRLLIEQGLVVAEGNTRSRVYRVRRN